MPLIRARHDVYGVCEIPDTEFYLDNGWVPVADDTATADEERLDAANERAADVEVIYDPARHRLHPVDDDDGVLAYLQAADDEERARVIAAEAARGEHARTTVLEWQPYQG